MTLKCTHFIIAIFSAHRLLEIIVDITGDLLSRHYKAETYDFCFQKTKKITHITFSDDFYYDIIC